MTCSLRFTQDLTVDFRHHIELEMEAQDPHFNPLVCSDQPLGLSLTIKKRIKENDQPIIQDLLRIPLDLLSLTKIKELVIYMIKSPFQSTSQLRLTYFIKTFPVLTMSVI